MTSARSPANFFRVSRDIAPSFLSAMFNLNFANNFLTPFLDDPQACSSDEAVM